MGIENLTIIGTSHIARESIDSIKEYVDAEKPDIIALELDRRRFISLTSKNRKTDIFALLKLGVNGFVFMVLGRWAQRFFGKMVGVEPGSEMLAAIRLAKKHKIPVALIDQDIELTLKKLSSISWRERFKILLDALTGVVFRKNELKKLGIEKIDLSKVPDDSVIQKLMKEVRQRYPDLYRILVEERNVHMADALLSLAEMNPDKKILAVVGAGHEKEILSQLRQKI